MKTLLGLTVANLKGLTRDRAALFWTFFFPIMFVLLFGVLFSGSGDSKVTVGVVDQDGTAASAQVRAAFAGVPFLVLKDGTLGDEKAAMQNGDVSAVIVIPEGLQDAVVATKSGSARSISIQLYTDPAQTQTAQVVQSAVSQVSDGFSLGVASGGTPAILKVSQMTLSSTNISTVTYLVPSILAMALMQLGVFAAVPLVQQREKGILKRMGATPLQRWKLVASNILLRLIVAAVDTVLILGVGIAVFNIQLVGNLALAAGFVFLGAGAFLALGFMLASFLKTEEQATGVVQVVQMPLMFLSGIFFPFTFMPGFLQSVARLLPLTYLGDGLRQSMVNAPQVAPLAMDAGILAAWMVVCLAISARSFRWE
ncbi:MAG TPA: ABC transporter permease [Candidatus Limnocylindrales bacterium]|jgi:ABC-2 type transport system permease protein